MKWKTSHGKSEEKGEFGNPRNESLCFNGGTPIMLGPTRANSKTPFERFIGKTHDFNHLKVFGSLAYVHVDKEEKNLDAKAIKTTFIGYDSKTKGFRCYSLLLQKNHYV